MSQRFDVHWELFFLLKKLRPTHEFTMHNDELDDKENAMENRMDVWIFSFQCGQQMGVETVQFELLFCGSVFSEMLLFVRELNGRP